MLHWCRVAEHRIPSDLLFVILSFWFVLCIVRNSLLMLTDYFKGPQIRGINGKLIFLFLNQNICYGYSKEPSH